MSARKATAAADRAAAMPGHPIESGRDWRRRGACTREDPELFFPVGTGGPARLQTAAAKKVCRTCPVVEQCLSWAVESGQDHGVWGGQSADERRSLRRKQTTARGSTNGAAVRR